MVTILLQKILDLLKENLSNMIKFFVTDPQDGQTLVYDAESEEWKNDYVEIELQKTASGAVATFDTEATLPLVSLKANITATQSGTGTPSPSNPRPISGFSSVTLTQKDSEDNTVDTFTISLGDTYYGGVLDCKNGTATITHEIINMEDLNWTYNSTNQYFQCSKPSGTSTNISLVCSCYKYTGSTVDDLSIFQTGSYFRVQDLNYTDAPSFKTAVTGQKICYGLATPITLTGLTPDNFTTIAGENNIFADSGDVEVIYNTSSAQKVWDISNHVKDLTSGLTVNSECIDTTTADIRAYQEGHLVYVQIQNLKYTVTPEDTTVIVTGLPKAKLVTNAAVADGYDLANSIRLRVNTDGELQQWYTRPYPNHYAVGQIVYITDEV